MVRILSEQNSIINRFIAELRDVSIQNDRARFRRNLERIGEIAAYEISKTLPYHTKDFTTPLGVAPMDVPSEQPVVATILRAGLPLHQGVLNYFDHADNAFISAYRKHHKDGSFEISLEYVASPSLDGRIVILTDPMLATGQSLVAVLNQLHLEQKPKEIHIAVVIAAPEGIAFLEENLPENCHLWVAALDEKLNDKKYIVPGLGDAGDLAYGSKL